MLRSTRPTTDAGRTPPSPLGRLVAGPAPGPAPAAAPDQPASLRARLGIAAVTAVALGSVAGGVHVTTAEAASRARHAADPAVGAGPGHGGSQPGPRLVPRRELVAAGPAITGVASWYGEDWNGRRTANGEIYDAAKLTAASKTLPFGTVLDVCRSGRCVQVRVNDRGPYVGDRVLDLSHAAAARIGLTGPGTDGVRATPVVARTLLLPPAAAAAAPSAAASPSGAPGGPQRGTGAVPVGRAQAAATSSSGDGDAAGTALARLLLPLAAAFGALGAGRALGRRLAARPGWAHGLAAVR